MAEEEQEEEPKKGGLMRIIMIQILDLLSLPLMVMSTAELILKHYQRIRFMIFKNH